MKISDFPSVEYTLERMTISYIELFDEYGDVMEVITNKIIESAERGEYNTDVRVPQERLSGKALKTIEDFLSNKGYLVSVSNAFPNFVLTICWDTVGGSR